MWPPKEKRVNFSYELMFCRTSNDLNKVLKDISKKGEIIPMLMFLCKDREEN